MTEEQAFYEQTHGPVYIENFNFDEIAERENAATTLEVQATRICAQLMSMAATPGQTAAARHVLGLDSREPCKIAISLRMSRQRFAQLRKQALQRLELIKGDLTKPPDE